MFNTACSSSASERNFSAFQFIHSISRNRPDPSRVEKLVFMYFNTIKLESLVIAKQNVAVNMLKNTEEKTVNLEQLLHDNINVEDRGPSEVVE